MSNFEPDEKATILNLLQKELRILDIRSPRYAHVKGLIVKLQTQFKGDAQK